MQRKVSDFRVLVSAALVVATGIATNAAFAEELAPITVEAARSARSAIGAPISTVTTQRVVTYKDISLTTDSGVKVIENRIREAASSACAELDKKYPITAEGESTTKCYEDAVRNAMAEAHKRIDAAKLAARK